MEKVAGRQPVRARGGVIAVMYETRWAGESLRTVPGSAGNGKLSTPFQQRSLHHVADYCAGRGLDAPPLTQFIIARTIYG